MNKTDFDDLLSSVKEIEELLQFPSLPGHIEKANQLALSVARRGPSPIPYLAMMVGDAVTGVKQKPRDREAQQRFAAALARLREALELKKAQAPE